MSTTELISTATPILGDEEVQSFSEPGRYNSEADMHAELAERVYYQIGTQFIAQHEWNSLTRLQMIYELRLRSKFDDDEGDGDAARSDWQLRVRLRAKVEQEAQEKRRAEAAAARKKYFNTDGDDERKTIYVKHHGRIMVF